MNTEDFPEFADAFSGAWAFHKALPESAVLRAFDTLRGFPLDVLLAAIQAHQLDPQRGQYGPKPADLVAQIQRHMPAAKHIDADEAWALCPGSEEDTAVWTQEMCEAYAVALPLLLSGDRIGARMAFKSAYARIVSEAERLGRVPTWTVSEGFDPERKATAIWAAIQAGRLTGADADEWRERLALAAPASITPLLEGYVARTGGSEAARKAAFAEIRKALKLEPEPGFGLSPEDRDLSDGLDWERIYAAVGWTEEEVK